MHGWVTVADVPRHRRVQSLVLLCVHFAFQGKLGLAMQSVRNTQGAKDGFVEDLIVVSVGMG